MIMPKDPFILLSYVNMKLRDNYSSLDALMDDLGDEVSDIPEILASIGYSYDPDSNSFIQK